MKVSKSFDVYFFLTHAMWHCQWGSGTTDRIADEGDLQAACILNSLRRLVAKEVSQ